MPTFSASDIAQLAVNNGFPNNDSNNLATCVAIALAESGGNSLATSADDDRGIWQINWAAHNGEFAQRYPNWYDPDANAQMMMAVSSGGTNWGPWVTYNNGDYQKHMADAVKAVGGTTYTPGQKPTGGGPSTTDVANSAGIGDNFVVKFFRALTTGDVWVRFGQLILGAIVILIALSVYFNQEIISIGKSAVKAAETAALL